MRGASRMAATTPAVMPTVFATPSECGSVNAGGGISSGGGINGAEGFELGVGGTCRLLGLEAMNSAELDFEQYSGSGMFDQCNIGEQECCTCRVVNIRISVHREKPDSKIFLHENDKSCEYCEESEGICIGQW
jgi:hypothetical protein